MACFHNCKGSLVDLTNGNRTASRRNPAQEFNNGVVLSNEPLRNNQLFEVRLDRKINSWSGSIEIGVTSHEPTNLDIPTSATGFKQNTYIMSGASILKDGHTHLEEYGRDLDQLVEGDRVGVMRNDRGALHFYVNGEDQGPSVTDMPGSKVWAVVDMYGKCAQVTVIDDINRDTIMQNEFRNERIQEDSFSSSTDRLIFHDKTGTLIRLSNGRRTAERRRPLDEFNNGVVMTNRAIRDDEMFEIRIDRLVDKWSGSIEVGITAHDPATLDFPATMTNMRSGRGQGGGTVMMSGCGILTNGKGTRREYGDFNLDELQEGDHIGLMRKSSGALHYYINGQDQGVAAPDAPRPAWGVVDLYGMAVKVTIVDRSTPEDGASNLRGGALASALPRLEERMAELRPYSPQSEPGEIPTDTDKLLFHPHCGVHAAVINSGLTAHRPNFMDDFNAGVVLTNRPLTTNEMFEVRLDKLVDKWAGSVEIGVTTHSPLTFEFPSTMTNVRSGTWMMTGNGVMHNGTTIRDDYGQNLDQLEVGDRVGTMLKEDGTLHFYVNGVDQGAGASNVLPHVYGVIDLYGQAAMASIVHHHEESNTYRPIPENITLHVSQTEDRAPRPIVYDILRFHPRHGRNAIVSADGRTASRINARGEFNDAIVITSRPLQDNELFEVSLDIMVDRWSGSIEAGVTLIMPDELDMPSTMTDINYDTWMLSGSAVMKDGSTIRNGYKVDLDALPAGTRVGMLRASDATLHFYVNGVDMGVACSGVPSDVYAVIDLYGQCAQVSITESSRVLEPTTTLTNSSILPEIDPSLTSPICTAVPVTHRFSSCAGKHMHVKDGTCDSATRVQGFNHGLLFSMEPLSPLEIFEVRVERVNRQWSGSLHVGLTSLAVSDGLAHSLLPASALELRTSPSWVLAGSRVISGGQTVTDNYGPSLSRLDVGDRVGVMYTNSGEMHVFINGQDLGSAASGIPEGVFAIVDVFGATEQVSITSTLVSPHVNHLPASGPPSIHTLDSFTGAEQEEDETEGTGESQNHCFHTAHGRHVTILADNRTAARHASYNQAIVLSERPLVTGDLFQVRVEKIVESWSTGLGVGVVACSPERLVLAPRAISLQQPTWVVHGRAVYHAGKKIRDGYGIDLNTLVEGSLVGVRLDETGSLHIHIDGTDQGVACSGLPTKGCHVIFDLYGRCEHISIQVPQASSSQDCQKEKADNEQYVKEKNSSSSSVSSEGQRPCEYEALCARFIRSLALPDGFFNASHNRCFCNNCQKSRGDAPYYRKGEPPKDFAIPVGWSKFALKLGGKAESQQKLEKWHVAFHGAHVSSIRRSLDTQDLIPAGEEGVRTLQPQLFTRDEKNKPEGDSSSRDKQLYFSPTIKYSGLPKFSPPLEWRDPQTRKVWQAQVAWQLCVKPGSYRLAHDEATELVLHEERIDSRFANSEIAWHTKEKGAITMVALLVKIV